MRHRTYLGKDKIDQNIIILRNYLKLLSYTNIYNSLAKMTSSKTTDFCDANNIEWFPINLTIDGNGKQLNVINHKLYSFQRPDLHNFSDKELIKARQHLYKTQPELFTHICMNTKNVYHIDIDTQDYNSGFDNIAFHSPYFKSMTKSYGKHILIKVDGFTPTSKRMQFSNDEKGGVELLCGCGSYAPFEMINADKPIMTFPGNDFKSMLVKENRPKSPNSVAHIKTDTTSDYEKIKEMSEIISDNYICKKGCYDDWKKIIWALHSMGEQYREIAHSLSNRRGANYDYDDLNKLWDDCKIGIINIGTFYHYAKISNETKFKEICTKYAPPLDISLDELTDIFKCAEKIAPTIKKILKLCNETWWVLGENQLWKTIKDPAYYIILEIRKYIDFSENKIGRMKMIAEGEEAEKLHKIRMEYMKHYEKINSPSFISLCKSYLKVHLCDNDFEDKLNINPNQLAFQNGIVDLKTGELRPGGIQWDDYLTDTIRYDYEPADPVKIKQLKGYLKQIMNNDDSHLEYFLQILGFSFLGTPHLEKSLYFMIDGTEGGKGDNGKTFYFDILDTLMPHYVYKSKGTLLEDGNTKVHKQLVMTKGKRLVWTDEFSKTKKMNAELMKELADGKTIENEVMFGTSDKINVLFKMFILSNFMIKIDPTQSAVYNRYKQASFCSNFDRTGKLKQSIPEQLKFIADPTLGDRIKNEYRNEVFGLIVEYAKKYNGRIEIPEKFLGDAKEAQLKNDEFGLWFNDNCELSDGRISIDKLEELTKFKRDFIIEGMSRLGFKYQKDMLGLGSVDTYVNGKIKKKYLRGGFIGCSIKQDEEENEDDFTDE